MKLGLFRLVALCALFPASFCQPSWAQDQNLPESPSHTQQTFENPASERVETWRSLPRDFLRDQKTIWLFPTQLAKGRHWVPALAIVGGTAGLIVADPHAMPYFRSHGGNLDDLNDTFSSTLTAIEIAAVPASFLAVGYARHDSYDVSTALLAGEALADSAVVDIAMKLVTFRERPSGVPPGAPFTNTFFNGSKSPFSSSFPSDHAAAVFSVATVVANRYRGHRWTPWLLYGFATAVSFSRVSTLSHFPSDVFLGAALGYTITRYQVLAPH